MYYFMIYVLFFRIDDIGKINRQSMRVKASLGALFVVKYPHKYNIADLSTVILHDTGSKFKITGVNSADRITGLWGDIGHLQFQYLNQLSA